MSGGEVGKVRGRKFWDVRRDRRKDSRGDKVRNREIGTT